MVTRSIIGLLLICGFMGTVAGADNTDSIERAFESFFGEPFQQTLGNAEVTLYVDTQHALALAIPVIMRFKVDSIEKVLLLKLKNTGYYRSGYLNQKCADEPVFLVSYDLNPEKKIIELESRVHTYCNKHRITFLLWARTTDGKYYSTSFTFDTVTESPG